MDEGRTTKDEGQDVVVDVVIPTRGRGALIDTTIASIRQNTHVAFLLWVVDQSNDDATEQAVTPHVREDSRVHYLRIPPRGSNNARNLGAAAGHAPYIAFTDDDCRADPGWLHNLVSELSHAETWAAFGRILPDETYHPVLPAGARPVSEAIHLALKDSAERRVYVGNRFDLSFGHGANMGFRRDRYEELNGFDELLGVGAPLRSWPERDFGYRILARGGRIVYTPDALLYHRHWRGWDEIRRTYRNYAIGAGAVAGKYVRCGDWGGIYLFVEWMLDQGVRQILSGLLKWHDRQKIEIGLLQLIYPWLGLVQGVRYPIDRQSLLYRSEKL